MLIHRDKSIYAPRFFTGQSGCFCCTSSRYYLRKYDANSTFGVVAQVDVPSGTNPQGTGLRLAGGYVFTENHARSGVARLGVAGGARPGLVGQGKAGTAWPGTARPGWARCGMAGKARRGQVGRGAAWQARPGGVWYGGVRQGMAGKVGRGPSRHGMARQAGLGKAWHGPSWCGAVWQARLAPAW
jgi:hypothetical protein